MSRKLLARLREVLLAMSNPHLRALVECFLIDDDFVRKFTTAPAGIKNHHAYQGGLLEHVVSLLNVADRITDLYPELDRDLLLTGIFLHDIGKVDELSYDRRLRLHRRRAARGAPGHGRGDARRKGRAVRPSSRAKTFPAELLLRLKHMIVSHHGTHEFGSPKLPMTLEAIALHYLDNLDAKIHTFSREIRDDPSQESSWTPFQQSLGRRLFKGNAPRWMARAMTGDGALTVGACQERLAMADFADRVAKLVAQPDYKPITLKAMSRHFEVAGRRLRRVSCEQSSGSSRRASSTWPRTRPSAGPSRRA